MGYVDGFVLAVPTDAIDRYREIASRAGEVWIDHGALAYEEAVADDLAPADGLATFQGAVKLREGETVVFAWITYRSREHRDEVNASAMADPRLHDPGEMPFDSTRMIWGGFRSLVSLP
jgi:uncharacterized protein YbaA (DUF1428 family)